MRIIAFWIMAALMGPVTTQAQQKIDVGVNIKGIGGSGYCNKNRKSREWKDTRFDSKLEVPANCRLSQLYVKYGKKIDGREAGSIETKIWSTDSFTSATSATNCYLARKGDHCEVSAGGVLVGGEYILGASSRYSNSYYGFFRFTVESPGVSPNKSNIHWQLEKGQPVKLAFDRDRVVGFRSGPGYDGTIFNWIVRSNSCSKIYGTQCRSRELRYSGLAVQTEWLAHPNKEEAPPPAKIRISVARAKEIPERIIDTECENYDWLPESQTKQWSVVNWMTERNSVNSETGQMQIRFNGVIKNVDLKTTPDGRLSISSPEYRYAYGFNGYSALFPANFSASLIFEKAAEQCRVDIDVGAAKNLRNFVLEEHQDLPKPIFFEEMTFESYDSLFSLVSSVAPRGKQK